MTPRASRPTAVNRASACLWISAAIVLLATGAQLLGWVPLAGATPGMTATIGLVTAGLLAVVAASISARHGWVRWLFIVLYVLGTLGGVAVIVIAPEAFRAVPLILQLNTMAQFILQTAALVFMFHSTSRQWFAAKHAETAP